ncbi:putative endoglucanase [Stachybotrys elegans]|uniref:Endoglucanase n=1 Tax=Stachybotrys elegans TaxID=80388 RepID=A0A8K0SPE7_9HYPO|nr:putative endoglucanase [Stachybotrys elegans]
MKTFAVTSILCLLASGVTAHMQMTDPAPLRSKSNPHTTNADYSMTSPLLADGSNFPCKGYHSLLGTPQGASVATWQPGEKKSFTLSGTAVHGGGSCQASLSYDKGKTWTVIESYIGNCPLKDTWDFTVPRDAKAGSALFAWTWFNKVGNREMYMNCASVTIGGKAKRDDAPELGARAAAFSRRPAMFVANVGNGCSTLEGKDVAFPNPGPAVENEGSNTAPPQGKCGNKRHHARSLVA